jgi:arginine/lysine/ornithine decarboxylase
MNLYNLIRGKTHKERFHTPGHAGKIFSGAGWDITELPDTDNLQNPMGEIRGAEERAAAVYNVADALFFTSGATTAIFVALACVAERLSKICLIGTAHKSFANGARLAGLEVVNSVDKNTAVFVTSPDYFGVCVSRERLSELKQKAGLLVVDAAHGAHFAFSDRLPEGAEGIANLTVISPHKTMPVLTGGAILLVGDGSFSKSAKQHRSDLHTTSPSYPVLATLDYAVSHFKEHGAALYHKVIDECERFKKQNSRLNFLQNSDPTRLVVTNSKSGKIYAELEQENMCVYIVNPYNYKYLRKLGKEL